MDVKSLYTCIPHADGLTSLKYFLEKRPNDNPPANTLLRLAELVLNDNIFSFDDKYYLQESGVAMGSKLGPSYACLFVGHQEQLIFNTYNGPIPCLFERYMDDIIGATSLPLEDIHNFIHYTNSFHPALEFTWKITENSLPFLDILLTINNESIATSIYYKETDAHSFLDYNSSHHTKCKDSIPYSQLLRLRRICSDDADFKEKALQMISYFQKNNYPANVTSAALNQVNKLSQNDALLHSGKKSSNNRIPFTLTYHPLNNKIKQIIYRNYHILTVDTNTGKIFQDLPIMAFRRDKNIQDTL
eukprot:gene2763-3196_t